MLLLQKGSKLVDRDELAAVRTPAATETWTPVPHHTLVDAVESSLTVNGLVIRDSQFAVGRGGDRFFGLLTIADSTNPDYATAIGLRNANDMKVSAAIALGYKVLVCDNLAFSAEVVVKTRHTARVLERLPGVVAEGVASLVQNRESQDRKIAAYKSAEITSDQQLHDLVVRAYKADAFPARAIAAVLDEFENPRHEEFRERTVWSLLNAVTETLKSYGDIPRRTQRLHAVFDTAVSL